MPLIAACAPSVAAEGALLSRLARHSAEVHGDTHYRMLVCSLRGALLGSDGEGAAAADA